MASDRIKRQIERLLDSLEEAVEGRDWQLVRQLAEDVLFLDPDNVDAPPYLSAAERALGPKQPEEPKGAIPEQDHEVPDTFSGPVGNPNPPPTPISTEEFVEPPLIIAEASAETFAQPRVRVVRDEAEDTESNSISSVHARAVGPIGAITRAFAHCFDWEGRASRSEFWWFSLFVVVAHFFVLPGIFYLVGILGDNVSYYPADKYWYLFVVVDLALFTPFSFLTVRRLRDANKSILYALLVILCWLWWLNWYGWFGGYGFNSVSATIVIGIGNNIFLFGCLALCAMPSHSRAPAWSPDSIWKDAGLFILRAVIGVAIVLGLIFVTEPIRDVRHTPTLGLADMMINTFRIYLAFLITILLPLVLVTMLQSRFEGRSVLEPFRPEETNQELNQVTAVESTGQEEPVERQNSRSAPIREPKPEVVDQEPEHTIGVEQTEDYRKPPMRTEGFHWHWGILKRILLIAVVGLIFGVVGQFIAISVGVAGTPASAVFVLIGYIIGGIIGNKLYDQGVG